MNNFEYLLNRFLSKTATREERIELFNDHKEEFMNYLFETEKEKAGTGSEEIYKEEVFSRIVAEHPELKEFEDAIPIHRSVSWWKFAAAAVVIVGVSVFTYRLSDTKEQVQVAANETLKDPLYTFTGSRFIRLPDSSTVVLNEGSELSYHSSYGESTREVTLSGEGFFDVKPDPKRRFLVRSGKVTTSVLGTAFNVKAFPLDNKITVTVSRGKVQVGDDQHAYGTIVPNEQIAVNTTTYDFVKTTVNTERELAWKSDFIIIDNLNLEDAVAVIANKYKVKIILDNEDLKKCRITSTFLYSAELQKVLTAISTVVNATYTIKNGTVTIHGDGCK